MRNILLYNNLMVLLKIIAKIFCKMKKNNIKFTYFSDLNY